MYSLLIDSATDLSSVVLYKNGLVIDFKSTKSINGHSSILIPLIEEIIKKNNITPLNISEIFVVSGPGSFTGTRIGVTIAKVFAYSLKISIKTISTLELKAISSNLDKKLCVVKDPNGYYAGLFDKKGLVGEYFYLSTEEFNLFLQKNKYQNILVENIDIDFSKVFELLKTKETLNVHEVNPLYVKKIEVLK